MPTAIFEANGLRIARSPYGGSVGGPAFEKPLTYSESREIVATLLDYLTKLSISSCQITMPPSCCYREFSETFRLALLEHGFRYINRDISSVVKLGTTSQVEAILTSRARNAARQALEHGITFPLRGNVTDFWQVMEKTFQKHGSNPTHTLDEFQWLCEHLPDQVYADIAYLDNRPVAGIGYFGDELRKQFVLSVSRSEFREQHQPNEGNYYT